MSTIAYQSLGDLSLEDFLEMPPRPEVQAVQFCSRSEYNPSLAAAIAAAFPRLRGISTDLQTGPAGESGGFIETLRPLLPHLGTMWTGRGRITFVDFSVPLPGVLSV